MSKKYDILLCGVTGFTGKLAAEFLMYSNLTHPTKKKPVTWAVCARSEERAVAALAEAQRTAIEYGFTVDAGVAENIEVEVVDLVCETEEQFDELKSVVEKASVVISTAGPFDKYGHDLVRACVEAGVHYADITGETNFVRNVVEKYDEEAKNAQTTIVHHCGHDCVPWDISVWHMNEYAKKTLETDLQDLKFYNDLVGEASGGTLSTVAHVLSSKKSNSSKLDFDPLLLDRNQQKSPFGTKVIKANGEAPAEFEGMTSKDWVMAAVNGNCIRRSNALLGYNESLTYYDGQLKESSFFSQAASTGHTLRLGLGVGLKTLGLPALGLIPNPGSGPSREFMEQGKLTLHGRAVCSNGKVIKTLFHDPKDPGYLDTAKMLVACGYLLLRDDCSQKGGVVTPAFAFGNHLTEFLEEYADFTFSCFEEGAEENDEN